MTSRDPHLPVVHLRPPSNWVNDPNGLVFHDGAYHVFFQYNPAGVRHENIHWAHVRSRDLLEWEPLPVALEPTPDGADADGVWSGNAVSTGDTLVAFYSARRNDRWWQPIASALSTDGVTFDKGHALAVPEPPPGATMFRDPYVWRDGDRWRMLVGAALQDGRGAAIQYVSDDLTSWHYQGPYLARAPEGLPGGRDTEEGWECVQYAALAPDRGALIFSAWDPTTGAAHAAAYVGRDHGTTFEPDLRQPFDHGPDCYAPALLHAPDGRWLAWAWIWEARDEPQVGAPSSWTDEVGWAGLLSLPREITLGSHGLHQAPAREIARLRGRVLIDADGHPDATSLWRIGPVSRTADVTATLTRSDDGRAAAGLRLVTSNDDKEYLDLYVEPTTGDLVVDRSAASRDPRAKRGAWTITSTVPSGGAIHVRAVIDHSVIEVFTSTGEALTLRFYPTGKDAWQLLGRTVGRGEASLSVKAWELTPLTIGSWTQTGSATHGSRRFRFQH